MSQWSNNSQSQKWRSSYRTPAKPKKVNGCVIIADIGAASSKVTAEGITLAEKTKQCISYALQHKIFLKEQDDFGLVLCGSETTQNRLFKETNSHYKHINVLADMQLATWDLIKSVEREMGKPTDYTRDWMDALSVALDMIEQRVEAGVLYEELRILVLTDFDQPVRSSKRTEEAYIAALNERGTRLFFINDEEPIKSESNNPSRMVAQRLISQMNNECGYFLPFNDLYDSAIVFSKRPKLGTAWSSTLDIGNEIKIPVVGYIKVRQGDSFFKWKTETSDESIVERDTRYQTGSGENIADIDSKDVVDAYKYGKAYVPMAILKDKATTKCLSVLAFVDPVPSHFFMGNGTVYFYARKADKMQENNCEQIALSAFIHAMHDMGRVALVRRVYGAGYRPALGILSPRIKPDYECLVYNEVPFADDHRKVEFSPIINSKNNPSEEQLSAMDKLIDDFSLMKPDFEELKSKEVVDLEEEHIRHSVGFKILHPDEPLPGILPHIKSNMEPLPSLLIASKELLDRIKTLFPLEVLDRLRVNGSEAAKRALVPAASNPEEELENPSKKLRLSDSEALMGLSTLLGESKVLKIGTVHPAEDYVNLRKRKPADEVDREMERVMVSLLHDSLGTNLTLMAKVGNCIKVYRQSAPEFNRWIRDFKQIVIDHHYETFWKKFIVDEQLGLNDVSPDEARQFLLLPSPSAGIEKIEVDDDDLADLI